MLEQTFRLTLPPSSNLRQAEDTSWLHALPTLAPEQVLWVGPVPLQHRATLEERGSTLTVVDDDFDISKTGDLPTPDLTVLWQCDTPESWLRWLASRPDGEGTVALRTGSVSDRLRLPRLLERVIPPAADWQLLSERRAGWRLERRARRAIRLVSGRLRRLVPNAAWRVHDSDPHLVRPRAADGPVLIGGGMLLRGAAGPESPPRYLRVIAHRHGVKVSGRGWSLGAARGFRSQKVIISIDETPDRPGLIVKTTQSPRFNGRLQAEGAALEELGAFEPPLRMSLPRPVFGDAHAGLAVLAQTHLSGVPFRRAAEPSPASSHLHEAIAAVTDLAARTRAEAPPGEVEAALLRVVVTHEAVWSPPAPVTEHLRQVAMRVSGSLTATVFTHGDMGVWNMLARPDGRIGVLDWENADPAGTPLWDLFELVRTFGVFLADASGVRYGPAVFRRQLLSPSPLRSVLSNAITSYCAQAQIPTDVSGDLFTLCWAHNANREAATLRVAEWPGGRNNAYLKECLTGPTAPGA